MGCHLHHLLVTFSLLYLRALPQSQANAGNRTCHFHCGVLQVPYPFGIGSGCSLPGFEVNCSTNSPPTLSLAGTTLQILSISNGAARLNSTPYTARDCAGINRSTASIRLPSHGPFTFSDKSNSFTAIGCDTVAVVADGGTFTSGCVSLCSARPAAGICSGVGCCRAALPAGKRYLGLGTTSMYGYKNVSRFDNCSYSFLVESGGYEFKLEDLKQFPLQRTIAVVVDWAITTGDCTAGGGEDPAICGENARCVHSRSGKGYLCNCLYGFSGNPYLHGREGCQDIDECKDSHGNACVPAARCRNIIPGYRCECPFGSAGDGTRFGTGCRNIFLTIEAIIGTGLGLVFVLLCAFWFYSASKKRTLLKLREQYFRQNGGVLLKQQLSTRDGTGDCARIFSSEELRLATDDYDASRVLGSGGYGTVYKGTLEDGTTVAIKKSKVMDQAQVDQFVNELVILTQINHRNVVRILGCCLETEVPMLVYEFVSNGTLHEYIHENKGAGKAMMWRDRLRVATETAEALAYLHSAASMPIYHRDVKSSNILLDANCTAKVADFGISRLVPLDQTQVPTLVQGTLGYLDPEYFQTGQLTDKSDVYSFGVVLVELLTGQRPVSTERSKEESNLAMFFLSSMRNKTIYEFMDTQLLLETDIEQLVAVAELARKCLLIGGEKRPSMKEVAQELYSIANRRRLLVHEEEDDGQMGGDSAAALRDYYSLTLFGDSSQSQDSIPSQLYPKSTDLAR